VSADDLHSGETSTDTGRTDTGRTDTGRRAPTATGAERFDWRIWFGITLTLAWLGIAAWYIFAAVGWSAFVNQSAESLGSFLEGAFAPLAFLWLVIGYYLQQRALNQNNRSIELQYQEMRKSAAQAEIQAKAIIANERHTRQETFLKISELVNVQLGVIAGLLYLASQRPATAGGGALDAGRIGSGSETPESLWTRVSEGDPGVFSRKLIELCYGPGGRDPDGARLFFGTQLRRRYTQEFIETFEDLLASARECDDRGLISNALLGGSAHGHLYRTIKAYVRRDARAGDGSPVRSTA